MKRPFVRLYALFLALTGLVLASPMAASAATGDSFVRLGVSNFHLVDKGNTYVNGVLSPGSGYSTNRPNTLTLGGGMYVAPHWAIEGSITAPATTHNIPAGNLAGLPNLGDDQFTVATVTATWHPMAAKRFSPYLGAGLAGHFTTKTTDGLGTNFTVKSTAGLVLQAGADYRVSRKVGLYLDIKKAFYTAKASGDIGPSHLSAHAKLDPVIVQAGVSFHF